MGFVDTAFRNLFKHDTAYGDASGVVQNYCFTVNSLMPMKCLCQNTVKGESSHRALVSNTSLCIRRPSRSWYGFTRVFVFG